MTNLRAVLVLLSYHGIVTIAEQCPDFQLNSFQSEMLRLHNKQRSLHTDTGMLCWSDYLARLAKKHAERILETGENTNSNASLGENRYVCETFMCAEKEDTSYKDAFNSINTWLRQEKEYRTNPKMYNKETLQFTQIIWKSTKSVGCGWAFKQDVGIAVVCNYKPGGSFGSPSFFAENVGDLIECEVPSLEYGMVVEKAPYYIGDRVKFECKANYTLNGVNRAKCTHSGWVFDGKEPTCTGCLVPMLHDGFTDPPTKRIIQEKETVTFTCNDGYVLEPKTKILRCMKNSLIGTLPRCRKLGHCLRPEIQHGYVHAYPLDDKLKINESPARNLVEGTNVTFWCREGYDLVGNATGRCSEDVFKHVPECRESGGTSSEHSSCLIRSCHLLLILLIILPVI